MKPTETNTSQVKPRISQAALSASSASIFASSPLNPRQQLFADKYLELNNASEAARQAGYSPKTAFRSGQQNMQKVAIRQYIDAKLAERAENSKTDQQRILEELRRLAFFNAEDISRVDEDGNPTLDFSNAKREHYAAVTSLQTKTRKIYSAKGEHIATEKQAKVSLADKYRGLELLGKHLGMFKEAEQRVVVDVADRLLSARRRMQEALPLDGGELRSED